MTNNQNKFYTSISKHYSEIFPYKPVQLQFVKSRVGALKGKKILDIGCATGELAFQLAKEGANVTGIDLNEDLLKQAKLKRQQSGLTFQAGNMLELQQDFGKEEFDAVLCFGNTLVHLPDKKLVSEMLLGVESILKPGGKLLLQILNYDYILDEKITELPLIETEKIRFIRKYQFEKNGSQVRFQTELQLKKEDQSIQNETILFALRSDDLHDLLHMAGFKNIQFFANFKREDFGGKHIPLVASCEKR